MDYPCGKFCDCIVSAVLVSFVRTNTQTHTNTQRLTHTDAAKRFTPASDIGVSNSKMALCCVCLVVLITELKLLEKEVVILLFLKIIARSSRMNFLIITL